MGETITLRAADKFELDAYLAKPTGAAKGAVVVIQEIFGVNSHIRQVTDGMATAGYVAIAPALFDRAEKGVELGYAAADITAGAGIARGKLKPANTMMDVQAAIDYAQAFGKVGVVGYCFGGLVTWLAAGQATGLSCAVGYYGGGIAGQLGVTPKVPVMLHFGEKDAHIPLADVNKIKEAHPDVVVYTYDADHGFNCDHRGSYDAAATAVARERTLTFFATHL